MELINLPCPSVIYPSGQALVDVRSVSANDAGTYICRAQSAAGTKEERVEVIGMSCRSPPDPPPHHQLFFYNCFTFSNPLFRCIHASP